MDEGKVVNSISKKMFLGLCLSSTLPFLFLLFFLFKIYGDLSRQNLVMLDAVDNRISNIVLSTLRKVREDIGILSTDVNNSVKKGVESEESKVENVDLTGLDNLRTFPENNSFWVGNTIYRLGDVCSPYGICIAVGRDMVMFRDFGGKLSVVGKNLVDNFDSSEEKVDSSEKTS